ncbi:MAG: 4Fe-4S dicluster domain-containing protein [Deltaproteobacteria bacterium]|jgi:menaquinone reductase, iron-sulfur cluster-binding subunit|nr:4Fe-4S dicluster domain-containing protein [Deltaproteobacteria bacterium]MBT4644291.1 4Fe-4S dicluster domain-containing protein [Deltaproteobacteria bacterium]MBT6500359.1 4Fe-4S dicluster domain-containing protein [Deltaproteobacteria bacterium]MBT6611113.1 4Fe-4S dicluster domain-containing protein [Deltaproteobacteria bacterium]MBT7151118.1 4Fe-4S dicluster domain-containing protein [Deltaproteobacteria bacterium]
MEKTDGKSYQKFGMVIDLDKCTGCGSCMVACMSENNISFRPDETDKLRSISWMRVYKLSNQKPFPQTDLCYLPMPCMHCEGADSGHSPCISVCPVTATDYDKSTGIVSQIYTRCFGCRYCMVACPYQARYFNWWDPVWPKGMEKMLNPDVSPRMRGVVEKCSFCYHRLQSARDKAHLQGRPEIPEQSYQTACAQACPAGAITFGDLKNANHSISSLVKPDFNQGGKSKNPKVFRLLEKLDTKPSLYYSSSKQWVRDMSDNKLREEKPQPTITMQNSRERRN